MVWSDVVWCGIVWDGVQTCEVMLFCVVWSGDGVMWCGVKCSGVV